MHYIWRVNTKVEAKLTDFIQKIFQLQKIGLLVLSLLFLVACGSKRKIVRNAPSNGTSSEELEQQVAVEKKKDYGTMTDLLAKYLRLKYKSKSFDRFLYVSAKQQKMYLIQQDSILKTYPISTAKKGIGNRANSQKTPSGLHSIKKKYGSDVPIGGILKSRVYTNKIATIYTDKVTAPTDDVTSRIMWLQGEERGVNKGKGIDSYKRYIYIHGTPEEGLIGNPASHGCIRMKNKDVIELFDIVKTGTPVLILNY